MNRFLTKLWVSFLSFMVVFTNVVFADPTLSDNPKVSSVQKQLGQLATDISNVAQPVGAFFILMSVLMVGFNIIKNRDKAEDRTKAMESLMWLGIGAFIIGIVLTVGPAIAGMANGGAVLADENGVIIK